MEQDNADAIPPVLPGAGRWPVPQRLDHNILGIKMKSPADIIPQQDGAVTGSGQLVSWALRCRIAFDDQGRRTNRPTQLRYGDIDVRLPLWRKCFKSIRIGLKEIACLEPVSAIS
jgi:hypothetical protein